MQMGTHVSYDHLKELFQPARGPVQYEGSEKKMWTEYMNEAEKYDGRAAEAWKANSDGLLVFTGLFSATVGAFIIEFYKKLSRDSGDQTVDLLCQISQQLPNFSNGSCFTRQTSQPSPPDASIIWVISIWMMSLLLSLTSALFATLLQQWARRYVQMPQIQGAPKDRACVRSFLFFGTRKYQMRISIETAPALLHLSVFLFFAGLVILFFSIHKTVAIIVSISVGIFSVAYVALTVLPYIHHDCLYRTPMSNIWWYISHTSLFSVSFFIHWLLERLHSLLVGPNLGEVTADIQHFLVSGLSTLRRAIGKHRQRLKDGFGGTIVQGLKQPSGDVDLEALTWWLQLPAMDEESKAQEILACIPKNTVVRLMRHSNGQPVFRERLRTLLRSCEPGSLAVGLDDNERKIRLLMCLHTIHNIALDSVDPNSKVDVDFMRANFVDIGSMQAMWVDNDADIRVTSRSICALLARYLLRRARFEASELAWLEDVTGETSDVIFGSDPNIRNIINLKAFVYGVLAHPGGDLPAEHATPFTETLAILMDAGSQRPFNKTQFRAQHFSLIQAIQNDATASSTEVVDNLRRMFDNI